MSTIRTAWLFTRGVESVRLEIELGSPGVRLLIAGPGRLRAEREFADVSALIEYQRKYEHGLRQDGFSLDEYITERRRRPR
jgi:hypothetical protein